MKATTVLGQVTVDQLGRTLTHEHININFDRFYMEPPPALRPYFNEKITLENFGLVQQYPHFSKTNVNMFGPDVDEAILEEMAWFKRNGGGTLVENTSHGIQRNVDLMVSVAMKTGVNIIAGTGYYVGACQSEAILSSTVEQMSRLIRREMVEGCVDSSTSTSGVKCGLIGEVGSGWPLSDFERRAIRATATVQEELGCPVSFHPGRHRDAPFEILRVYSEAGGRLNKADMSHLDRTLETEDLLEFAKLGSYCQFDLFGIEKSLYQLNPLKDMPSDAQRIDFIKELIAEGKEDHILVSHDIHTKHRLSKFGGHGYSHLITTVANQMTVKGIEKNIVDKIFIDNPSKWLSY